MLSNSLNIRSDSYSHTQKLPKFLLAKKQKSIKKKVFFKGKGLHTNNTVNMVLCPAPPNTGYLFKIKKENSFIHIKADFNNVKSTKLCTLISDKNGNTISTIEHVLSACYGMEIDNLYIELDSNEIPVCDGSSLDFVREIEKAGFQDQSEFKQFIKIKKTIEIKEDNKISRVSPFEQTMITCEIDYKHKLIGKQSISLVLNPNIYKSQICPARTFGFLDDVKKLRKMNLALGGNLDNAIVLDKNKILNEGGLRFSDEFVRHKVLDFIGDISLCGHRILGSFFTSHCGHDLNIKLLNKIFDSDENWELVCSN